MLAKQFSKFPKLGFNSIWTDNFQIFELDLEKAEEPEIKLPVFIGAHRRGKRIPGKKIYFIEYAKVFNCVDHNKLWEIFRDGNTRPPYLFPEIPVCRSESNS